MGTLPDTLCSVPSQQSDFFEVVTQAQGFEGNEKADQLTKEKGQDWFHRFRTSMRDWMVISQKIAELSQERTSTQMETLFWSNLKENAFSGTQQLISKLLGQIRQG